MTNEFLYVAILNSQVKSWSREIRLKGKSAYIKISSLCQLGAGQHLDWVYFGDRRCVHSTGAVCGTRFRVRCRNDNIGPCRPQTEECCRNSVCRIDSCP